MQAAEEEEAAVEVAAVEEAAVKEAAVGRLFQYKTSQRRNSQFIQNFEFKQFAFAKKASGGCFNCHQCPLHVYKNRTLDTTPNLMFMPSLAIGRMNPQNPQDA